MLVNIVPSLSIVIFTFLFLIISIDLAANLNIWQSRIHIGRWYNKEDWAKKIQQKSLLCLKKTPVVKLTDNNRLIFLDILHGNYKRDAIQHWQEAALLLGLYQTFEKTRDINIKNRINNYIDSKINDQGKWKNTPKVIDSAILGYAILKIDWIEHEKNKPAYDTLWNLISGHIGEDDTVKYRNSMDNYRYVDTIGLICPFLIAYGIKFNNRKAIDLGIRQITEFSTYGMLQNEFIPCHTYRIDNKLPVGLFGWGRGLGWYAIGLIDTWNELPKENSYKIELAQLIISFAKMVINFQNIDGSWNWLVTNKEARADSSATASLAWFLTNAAQIEEISKDCLSAKEKALQYLMKVTRRNGAIDFSQGDTKGIGVHSQNFDIMPFTQGFCLRTLFH